MCTRAASNSKRKKDKEIKQNGVMGMKENRKYNRKTQNKTFMSHDFLNQHKLAGGDVADGGCGWKDNRYRRERIR